MERIGIEHVPLEARHGRTSQLFTLQLDMQKQCWCGSRSHLNPT